MGEQGRGDLAAHRADVDDPALRRADSRQEGLGHRDLADDVDLELVTPLVERHELQRPGDVDARVVDQPGDRDLSHLLGGGGDRGLVGDVDLQRLDALVERVRPLGVLVLAHAGEDVEAGLREAARARLADPA